MQESITRVELQNGHELLEVTKVPCTREHYVTYKVASSRASGSVTFNTQPWTDSDCEIWVTAGKVTNWSFNGPQFSNDLTVDGFQVDFSGELPRGNPFPLRDKLYGQGLEFEWSGLLPEASRGYASAVVDAVVDVWHKSDSQTPR
jgi:hypothetical protein